VGWSHGREALRSGLQDTHKGSFYANPMQVRVRWHVRVCVCVGGGGGVHAFSGRAGVEGVIAPPSPPLKPRDTRVTHANAHRAQDAYDGSDGRAPVDPQLAARYPQYYSPNTWPAQHLPALQGALKALGQLMVGVGLQLAGHCSRCVCAGSVVRGWWACLHAGGVQGSSSCVLARRSCMHAVPPSRGASRRR
jgi:hypothetical protein